MTKLFLAITSLYSLFLGYDGVRITQADLNTEKYTNTVTVSRPETTVYSGVYLTR